MMKLKLISYRINKAILMKYNKDDAQSDKQGNTQNNVKSIITNEIKQYNNIINIKK